MQVLQNDSLARILHNALHSRMVKFAKQCTVELPAEPVVDLWLSSFYAFDNKNVFILIDLDDKYNVTAHCIAIVNQEYGYKLLHVLQVQDDKKSGTFLDECLEYLYKYAQQNGVYCIIATMEKSVKAMEKKYGYKTARYMLHKIVE